ncbi:unnamed protein product [Discosporangium mesarthrocarpum]
MGLTSMLVGTGFGLAAKGAMNEIRRIPLRREPWEYLITGGVGMWLGANIPHWEKQLLSDINEMRADRNMPPVKRQGGLIMGSSIVEVKET